jgi:hypothetical protein
MGRERFSWWAWFRMSHEWGGLGKKKYLLGRCKLMLHDGDMLLDPEGEIPWFLVKHSLLCFVCYYLTCLRCLKPDLVHANWAECMSLQLYGRAHFVQFGCRKMCCWNLSFSNHRYHDKSMKISRYNYLLYLSAAFRTNRGSVDDADCQAAEEGQFTELPGAHYKDRWIGRGKNN